MSRSVLVITANIITIVLILFPMTLSAMDQESDSRDELLILDRKIDKAYEVNDSASLEKLLADDFTWVHSGGIPIGDKAHTLNRMKSLSLQTKWEREMMRVKSYGAFAIVSGYASIEYQIVPPITSQFHILRVYVKSEDWKMVSQHTAMRLTEEEKKYVYQYLLQDNAK